MLPSWLSGERLALGAWCSLPSAYVTEILARAGYDWLCIDMQHGLLDYSDVLGMLQAASITATPTLVRVPTVDPAVIGKVLDAGATGILVPLVDTVDIAEQAVRACKYPPQGLRSWGPARAQLLADTFTAQSANAAVVCAVQIETLEAVANLDQILEVDGVDVVFVGPSDLAISMSIMPTLGPVPGRHEDIIKDIVARASRHGVACGIYCGTDLAAVQFHRLGYRMLAASHDALLLRQGSTNTVRRLRHELDPSSPPTRNGTS